jgi:hypothetical protein
MRTRALVLAAAVLGLLVPGSAPAAKPSRTNTQIKVKAPSPADATLAGFKLKLVKARKARAALARAAAGLPKNVTVYAVIGKQKRSDRVSGLIVVTNRPSKVSSANATATAARTVLVNIKHEAVPKHFKLAATVKQRRNVLDKGPRFTCGNYIRTSDLANAFRLGGPPLPSITIGAVFQSACASAKSSAPYVDLGEFRYVLNARSGVMTFQPSPQFPNEVGGTTSFNFPAQAFGVLADPGHQFTNCAFPGGTCAVQTISHPNDYVLFTLSAVAAPNLGQQFALATNPSPAKNLQFQFFGMDPAGKRTGPFLTKGP